MILYLIMRQIYFELEIEDGLKDVLIYQYTQDLLLLYPSLILGQKKYLNNWNRHVFAKIIFNAAEKLLTRMDLRNKII